MLCQNGNIKCLVYDTRPNTTTVHPLRFTYVPAYAVSAYYNIAIVNLQFAFSIGKMERKNDVKPHFDTYRPIGNYID